MIKIVKKFIQYCRDVTRNVSLMKRVAFNKRQLYYVSTIFGIAIIIVIGLIYIFNKPSVVEATWWNDTWSYRQSITITNSSGGDLTDFQVQVLNNVDLSSLSTSKLQADLGDLRFTDINHRILPYWIEDNTISSVDVWIKIPSISTTGTTIYMYYGNTNAPDAQSGNQVFEFFDDFDSLDTSKWDVSGSDYSFSSGVVSTGGGDYTPFISTQSFSNDGLVVRSKIKRDATGDFDSGVWFAHAGYNTGILHVFDDVANGDHCGIVYPTWATLPVSYTTDMGVGSWETVEMWRNGATVYSSAFGEQLSITIDANYNNPIALFTDSDSVGRTISFDYILIRKFASTDPTAGAPASEENAPGPIMYLNFDEGYGTTAYDSTGYGNNGTITSATWMQNGVKGRALSFDGINDTVNNSSMNYPATWNDAFSISTWMYVPLSATWHNGSKGTIISRGSYGGSHGLIRQTVDNEVQMWVRGDNGAVTATSTIARDKWYHLTGTWDGTIIKLYVNGVLKEETGSARTGVPDFTTWHMGQPLAFSGNTGNWFTGKLDEVRIYDRAISANEVKQLYNMNAGSFSTGRSELPTSCMDQLAQNPRSESGTYIIDPIGHDPFETYCDMETDGGGWTIGTFQGGESIVVDRASFQDFCTTNGYALAGEGVEDVDAWLAQKRMIWDTSHAIETGGWPEVYGVLTMPMWDRKSIYDLAATTIPANYTGDRCDSSQAAQFCGYYYNDGWNVDDMSYPDPEDYAPGHNNSSSWFSCMFRESSLTSTPGVVLDMPFEAVSGSTTYDISGNENNGTITSATLASPANCKVGQCFDFASSKITITDDTSLEPAQVTMMAWVWWDSISDSWIISKQTTTPDDYNHGYVMRTDTPTDELYCRFGTGAGYRNVTINITTSQWYNIACVYDGSTASAYSNGQLIATTSGGSAIDYTNTADLILGGHISSRNLNGKMDAVKIFDRALTQREIVMEMNSGKHQPVLDISFNEGGGDTAYDKSSFGNDGDLYGTCPGATTCPTWKIAENCINGSCLSFDGLTSSNGDYISIGTPASLRPNNVSIGAWAKIDSTKSTQFIGGYGNTGDDGYWLANGGGNTWVFSVGNSSGSSPGNMKQLSSEEAPIVGEWYHVYGTYDGVTQNIYVNGELKASSIIVTGDLGYDNLANGFYIGNTHGLNSDRFFHGNIDELRVYPYALTANEIKQEYAQSAGQFGQTNQVGSKSIPVTGGAMLDMDFDQYAGGVYLDRSGNSQNGTPSGDPAWKKEVHCKQGSCVELDSNDYIDWGGSIDNSTTTVTTWFNSTYTNQQRLFNFRSSEAIGGFYFDYNGNEKPLLYLAGSNYRYWSDTSSYMDGEWHFLEMYLPGSANVDISSAVLRIDNNIITSSSTANTDSQATWTNFYTGSAVNSFRGSIDQMKVYDRALTRGEVAQLYNSGAPIGWWRFDEGMDNLCSDGKDVCDNSGEGNNGSFTGSPTWITDSLSCRQGGCLSFDGSNDEIDLETQIDLAENTPWAVGYWFTHDSGAGGDMTIGDKDDDNNRFYHRDTGASYKIRFHANDGFADDFAFGSDLRGDGWHHVMVICNGNDSSNLLFYLDGEYIETKSHIATRFLIDNIGNPYTVAYYWQGDLDDVRIYNYDLSADQVKEVYNQGLVHFK
jgi:Concanavalin A-like lectin/glucanases superfamily/Domain of unknown function (DUF2341)/Fibrinogen beta and gamma chains, C-terminal globular domain